MRIERFRIQGYKSIVDLTVDLTLDGLADINVFFGLNDVGKSNILEALKLWWELLDPSPQLHIMSTQDTERLVRNNIFRLKDDLDIEFEVLFTIDHIKFKSNIYVRKADAIEYQNQLVILRGGIFEKISDKDALLLSKLKFHLIDAERRIQPEQRSKNSAPAVISARNLKQALFLAYLSPDPEQKKRFSAVKRVLAESPFELGELDVAYNPENDEINIGFVRSNSRLPIENLGSGVQQLLLILGQIFLNDYPIIAVEEPEMNLSPHYQAEMMSTLETLMGDPAVKLEQLFISTHSPYFEFTQNFYDVTYDPVKGTQVQRATNADYNQHFAVIPTGPDTGARLNSMDQVKLYEGVIEDLGLHRGDLVVFARNEAGRWEVHAGRELAKELQQLTNGSAH